MTTAILTTMNNIPESFTKKLNGNGWCVVKSNNVVTLKRNEVVVTFDTDDEIYWSNVRKIDSDTKKVVDELCMYLNMK